MTNGSRNEETEQDLETILDSTGLRDLQWKICFSVRNALGSYQLTETTSKFKFTSTSSLTIVSTSSCHWERPVNDKLLPGTQRENLDYNLVLSKASANPWGALKLPEPLRVVWSWGRLSLYTPGWISCWIRAAAGKAVCLRQSGWPQPRAPPWEGWVMTAVCRQTPAAGGGGLSLWNGELDRTPRASIVIHPPNLILHMHGTHNRSGQCVIISSI